MDNAGQERRIWIPVQRDPELSIRAENTFIYIRGYPSKEERDKRLKASHDDPEFDEVVTLQEKKPDTRLIVNALNIDMFPAGPTMPSHCQIASVYRGRALE